MVDKNYVVFAPEEFFGGAKYVSMNSPKFSNTTGIMKAFLVERNNPYKVTKHIALLNFLVYLRRLKK